MSEQQTERTTRGRVAGALITVMLASIVGMGIGLGVGAVIGYQEELTLFGLFAPIVAGNVLQLKRICEVKADAR